MSEKNNNHKLTEVLKSFSFQKIRKDQWVVVFLAGVLLLVIAIPTKKVQKKEERQNKTTLETNYSAQKQTNQNDSMDMYTLRVEKKLEAMLSQIEGAGKVRVMVTLKGTEKTILEKDIPQTQSKISESDSSGGVRETTENSWEEKTVFIQNEDGSSTPFVVQELEPQIEGVLILTQGGNNTTVVKNIYEAVQALFQIELHKIKVIKMEIKSE